MMLKLIKEHQIKQIRQQSQYPRNSEIPIVLEEELKFAKKHDSHNKNKSASEVETKVNPKKNESEK